jgi:valyl-tRNA synthetase
MNLRDHDADRFADGLRAGTEQAQLSLADRWILSRLQRTAAEVDGALEAYRFNDAAAAIYRFVWSELCDWYIELAKPTLYAEPGGPAAEKRRAAQGSLALALETASRLLHPFMPFITEEIWQQLPKPSGTPASIMITMYPAADESLIDDAAERDMELIQSVVVAVRNLRAEYNISPGAALDVTVQAGDEARATLEEHGALIRTLARVGTLSLGALGSPPSGTVMSVVGRAQVCVHLAGAIDVVAESARIDKDLKKTEKERAQVSGRLDNPSFRERAPADIVDKEKARLAELDEKLGRLRSSLERLRTL